MMRDEQSRAQTDDRRAQEIERTEFGLSLHQRQNQKRLPGAAFDFSGELIMRVILSVPHPAPHSLGRPLPGSPRAEYA